MQQDVNSTDERSPTVKRPDRLRRTVCSCEVGHFLSNIVTETFRDKWPISQERDIKRLFGQASPVSRKSSEILKPLP